jgi:hypothetical protein
MEPMAVQSGTVRMGLVGRVYTEGEMAREDIVVMEKKMMMTMMMSAETVEWDKADEEEVEEVESAERVVVGQENEAFLTLIPVEALPVATVVAVAEVSVVNPAGLKEKDSEVRVASLAASRAVMRELEDLLDYLPDWAKGLAGLEDQAAGALPGS